MEACAVPDVRERLHDVVDALVDESIEGVSTGELGADIIDIHRTIDRLEAELLRRLHRFDAVHGAQAEGGSTTVSWLRRCGMTVKASAYRVHLARALGELPAALDSARSGRASFCNVAMIAHLAKDGRHRAGAAVRAHPRGRGGDARTPADAHPYPGHPAPSRSRRRAR